MIKALNAVGLGMYWNLQAKLLN